MKGIHKVGETRNTEEKGQEDEEKKVGEEKKWYGEKMDTNEKE